MPCGWWRNTTSACGARRSSAEQATEHGRSGGIAAESRVLEESGRSATSRELYRISHNLSGVAEGSNALLLAGHIVVGNGGCTWFMRTLNQICTLNLPDGD